MGILVNQNQIGGGGPSNSSHNIGDIFYTTRTDNSLNGAVECNGSQYNFSDFDSNLQSLLDNGSIPSISIGKFDEMVAEQGGCDSFGYGTADLVLYAVYSYGGTTQGIQFYTNVLEWTSAQKDSNGVLQGVKLYDKNTYQELVGWYVKDEVYLGLWYIYNSEDESQDSDGYITSNSAISPHPTVTLPTGGEFQSTPYFKVPKKVGRMLVRSQKPTADNDYTWYNVYSDGWVEQGGTATAVNAGSRFTLPIEMSDANYTIVGGKQGADTDGVGLNIEPATTTQFMAGVAYRTALTRQFSWQVSGYAASSEYTKDKWNYQNVQVERPMIQLFNSTTDTAVATCNQVLADVSALNQGDYVIETQLPTEENNYSWYRLYKSGWVEQGKFRNLMQSNANTTCMLIIPMKDTNYFVTGVYDTNTSAINSFSRIGVGAKTTQSFQMRTEGGQYSWEVKGFANITN